MSNYCTNCKWLGKETNAGRTNWFCRKKSRIGYMLQSLCGNPTKLLSCINENWYELKVKQQEKKMRTKELMAIMQEYLDGKQIQWKCITIVSEWKDCTEEPSWHANNVYRVKPEHKYRQLKPEELIGLKGKWLHIGTECNMITRICVNSQRVWFGDFWRDAEYLLQFCLYENKQPVGILE